MEITIKGNPKEIAALVLAVQERPNPQAETVTVNLQPNKAILNLDTADN